MIKYEFDTWEEFEDAMAHLELYHNCEKCRGKIVFIGQDNLGNQTCGYCGEIVQYPKLKREVFEKRIKQNHNLYK